MSNEEVLKDADVEETIDTQNAEAEQATETVETETKAEAEVTEETAETTEKASEKKDKKEKKSKDDKKVKALQEKIDELTDKTVRQLAEFENFRNRTEKEKEAMFETGAKSVIEKILPVVDNFERGLATAPEGDPFAEGMQMIYKQLLTELENLGVKPIDAKGKEFDPNLHNAVMQVENEELESGTVAEELQKGYMYRDSVVRHSMVSVVS
ncbi:MAG: nucleotide exchange factor GrpE [Lachnospiraceae bacterium]|nr:nucleotide exchange factor GrpE [Lachnospiraceae bacterium]